MAGKIVVRLTLILLGFATFSACPAAAQSRAPAAAEVMGGSELENYLRMLQLAGKTRPYPWTTRGFSVREVERLLPADTVAVPWRLTVERLRARFAIGSLELNTVFNSGFPYGSNDGAVWAGR